MANSLGLESIPASVYSDNLTNGGASGHLITVNGLDADKTYVMYYIGGATKGSQKVAGFTLEPDGYSGIPKVEYVCTSGNSSYNTSTVTEYTSVSATTAMRAAADGYLLVRVSYIQPTTSGTISFKLSGERANICALAIAEIDPLAAVTRDLESPEEIWGAEEEWPAETVPGADENVKLNVISETGSKLTLDVDASVKDLTISGDCAVTFAGSGSLSAQNTILKADTDISGITASLGATTIAEGKTLTVGALNPATSIAGAGAVKITADSTWENGRDSGIKNLYIDNCTLTSTYVSSGSGIASGRTITVDGDSAVLFVNVGDGTGYSNGLDSLIAAKNGGKILFGSRDTLKTAVELTGGTVEIAAEAGNNNRAIDLFNSNDTVADFTVLAAEDATAENPTVSYITPLGTGIHRAIHLRGGNVEFNVAENAVLEISGYLVNNAGGGSAVSMKKTGVGLMTLCGSDASSCTTSIAVEGGTLKVIAPASLGTGAVTVADGATIAGSGTIGGTLTLVAGSTVDATDGSLTVNGNVTLPSEGEVTVKVAETAEAGATVITCANAEAVAAALTGAPAGLKYVADGMAVKLAAATPVSNNVAKIGDTEYETLQAAFEAVKDNETIVLLKDVTANVVLPSGRMAILDLNGQTINGYITVTGNSDVTTKWLLQNGTVINTSTSTAAISASFATIELTQIDLTSYYHCVRLNANGVGIVNSGTYIINRGGGRHILYLSGANTSLTVNGGSFKRGTGTGETYCVHADGANKNVTLNGGMYYKADEHTILYIKNSAECSITGGNYQTNPSSYLASGYLADTTINPGYYTVVEKPAIQLTIDLGDGVSKVDYTIAGNTTTITEDTTIDIAESGTVVSFTAVAGDNYFAPTVADVTVTETTTVTIAGVAFSAVDSADAAITDANRNAVYAWAKSNGKSQSEVSAADYLYADYLFNFTEFSTAEPTIEIAEFTVDPLVIKAKVTVGGETKIEDLSADSLELNGTLKYKAAATLEALKTAQPKETLDATDRFFKVVVE
ncbi:MAG: hypothetical protein IKL02_08800 [Kiritimatiellae bacterium]|nr:hypothetical protein [Kiritimatiellia bacterium]